VRILQKGMVFVFWMYECMVFMLRKYINGGVFQTTDSGFFSSKSGVSPFMLLVGFVLLNVVFVLYYLSFYVRVLITFWPLYYLTFYVRVLITFWPLYYQKPESVVWKTPPLIYFLSIKTIHSYIQNTKTIPFCNIRTCFEKINYMYITMYN
jgi:hypothetical protein